MTAPSRARRVRRMLTRLLDLAGRHSVEVCLVVTFAWKFGASASSGDWQTAGYAFVVVALLIGLIRSRERCYHLQKTNDELLDLLRYGREAALQRGVLRPATISRLIRHAARVLDNNSPKGPAK